MSDPVSAPPVSVIPVFVNDAGHRTFLKWHRGRKRLSDAEFTPSRILEGMAIGASVEVDLVVHGDKGFAILHDLTLERSTTGRGLVGETPASALRELHLRGNDGAPIADRVMLLEDLSALLERDTAHPDALLQLDYKQDAAVLDAETLANFRAAVAPVAANCILSSGDAEAVALLGADLPALRIGHDPCHGGAIERVTASGDYAGFVADSLQASPRAEMIYLEHRLILHAAGRGFDLVAAYHDAGRRVDAYTIKAANPQGVDAARRLLSLHVDQITTDDPEGLAETLSE